VTLTLRPYQREAVDAALAIPAAMRRGAIVLPTGAGKTVVIAQAVKEWNALSRREGRRDRRTVLGAHRIELVEQAAKMIRLMAPELRVGIVQGDRDNTGADVVCAMTQTLASERRRNRIKGVGLVVIDECHHSTATSYQAIMRHYGCYEPKGAPGAWSLGVTATMTRADKSALGDVWEDIVYMRSIAEMIDDGYLVRPRGLRVRVPDLDLRGVRRSRGDYSESDLGRAIEDSLAPEKVAEAYLEHAAEKQGIAFAPTVATAQLYADALAAVGIKAEIVHGMMAPAERAAALDRFRDGTTQVLCNCMVLTEGTDLPMAEVCVVGRPTRNKGLFIQMVGRVLRLWPGKDSALILDVVGATERNSLLGSVDLFGEDGLKIETDDPDAEIELDDLDDLSRIEEAEIAQAGADEPSWLYGQTEAVVVDLFHGSRSMWLRTRGGTWFIPAGQSRYIVVWPNPESGWDVLWLHRYAQGGDGSFGWIERGVPDLAYAMAFADDNVTRAEKDMAAREAFWRDDIRTSGKMRRAAENVGVKVKRGMTAGEISNAINVAMASDRIDWMVPRNDR
jgi:superfamily II DNA or RNA helicase